jgi:hypothetical protein
LKKFRQNFTNAKSDSPINVDLESESSDLPAHQLQKLFELHSDLNVNKTLINMQLAATHIAFMVQAQIKENVCPSFLGILKLTTIFIDHSRFSRNSSGIQGLSFKVRNKYSTLYYRIHFSRGFFFFFFFFFLLKN